MLHLRASTIALLPLLFSPIFANDTKLVGCDEVGCPRHRSNDRCTVEDTTFIGVGVSPISNTPSEGISLVKAVNVSVTPVQVNGSQEYPFRSFYYLGTPENIKAGDLSGCAIIFNNPPSKVFEYPMKEGKVGDTLLNRTDTLAATGTCSDVIEQSCLDTITQRARDAANNANGNACQALEQELKKDDFRGCSSFRRGQGSTSLGNFTIKSIRDLHAVRSSSDCWPVQRKSDNLMQIAEVISNGSSSRAEDIYQEAYKITPVLTVFGGDDGLVDSFSSQITCLKMVSHTHYPEGDGAEDSAAALGGSWLIAAVAALVGILTAL
ncbi:hypothetical protein FQN49_006708 [Arthroderma sp. PD_2]|nr:hypothetical protein FQN49_006708 [Arthroderma sp. PD_2]